MRNAKTNAEGRGDAPEGVESADTGGRTLAEAERTCLLNIGTGGRALGQRLLDEVGLAYADNVQSDASLPVYPKMPLTKTTAQP